MLSLHVLFFTHFLSRISFQAFRFTHFFLVKYSSYFFAFGQRVKDIFFHAFALSSLAATRRPRNLPIARARAGTESSVNISEPVKRNAGCILNRLGSLLELAAQTAEYR